MLYITLIIGLMLAFICKDKIRSAKIYTVFLAILAAFRYGIGADYFAYMYLYEQLKLGFLPEILHGYEKQEVGFRAFGSLLKTVGFGYQEYLAVMAVLTLYFIYRISVEYSRNPMFSMVVYYAFFYFVWIFSGLRQGLAMAAGMYFLLKAIHQGKRLQFVLVSILLFTIHSSSLVLMVLYLLVVCLPWNNKRLALVLSLSILFAFIPVGDIVQYFSRYIGVFDRIANHMDGAFTLRELLGFQVIPRLVFIGVVLYYRSFSEISPIMKKIAEIYLLSFAFYFIFQFSELAAARISVYGRILEIIILPNILYLKLPRIKKRIFLAGFLLLLSLYFVKEVNTMKYQSGLVVLHPNLVPYVSILNKDDYYYNTYFYYVLHYGATKAIPKNFHMIQ